MSKIPGKDPGGGSFLWLDSIKNSGKEPQPPGVFSEKPLQYIDLFQRFSIFFCTCNVILSAVPVSPRNRILSTALEVRGCPFFG